MWRHHVEIAHAPTYIWSPQTTWVIQNNIIIQGQRWGIMCMLSLMNIENCFFQKKLFWMVVYCKIKIKTLKNQNDWSFLACPDRGALPPLICLRGTAGLGTTCIPEHWGGSDITRPVPVRNPPSVRTYIPLPQTADASEAQHTGLCVQILHWHQRAGAGTSVFIWTFGNYSKYCYSVNHCTVSGSFAFNKMKPINSSFCIH